MSIDRPLDLLVHSRPPDDDGVALDISVESAGWEYCGLTVVGIPAGSTQRHSSNNDEVAIVLLGGDCRVEHGSDVFALNSRPHLFAGPPTAVYLPPGSHFSITATVSSEVALCRARSTATRPARFIGSGDVAIEIRGAGNAARQINHIITPDFPADRLLVVEVFTPSGNWSSYPPHKHDVSRMPAEADLEEIYYYRIEPAEGFAFQRLYTADKRIDQPFIIRDGDALIMPEGYHAYAVAHGYTGYYLNILAGDEPARTMQPFDDPDHAWIRKTWSDELNAGVSSWQDIDQRINGPAGKHTSDSTDFTRGEGR